MGRNTKYNWEELLKEYLASEYLTKTDFAKAKGINPSLLRRNTTNWPNKGNGETKIKGQKVSKKNESNVTQKDVTKKSNNKKENTKSNVTKNVSKKGNNKGTQKASNKSKSRIKDYLVSVIENESDELTEKELLFCFYFVNKHQFNATKSYQEAFGCTYDSARVLGCNLLTKLCIRKEINRLKKIKYQSIMLQPDDIVEKHMRIAFSNITDYVEFGRVEVPVMGAFGPIMIKQKVINGATGQEEERQFPLTQIVNDIRFKESIEVDGSLIKSVKQGRNGASIELIDPQKSMDWLEHYFEWNPSDKHKKHFEEEKLKLERQRLELEKAKINNPNEEKEDDGLLDALKAKAGEVWADENTSN